MSREDERKLRVMERDGTIDRWKVEYSPSGYARYYVQVDNSDEWILWCDEEDWV